MNCSIQHTSIEATFLSVSVSVSVLVSALCDLICCHWWSPWSFGPSALSSCSWSHAHLLLLLLLQLTLILCSAKSGLPCRVPRRASSSPHGTPRCPFASGEASNGSSPTGPQSLAPTCLRLIGPMPPSTRTRPSISFPFSSRRRTSPVPSPESSASSLCCRAFTSASIPFLGLFLLS